MNLYTLLGLICFCKSATSVRDYYLGVFNRQDLLVAQDIVYKDKVHHGFAKAKYVKYLKCPISYFRVMDRLGVGSGPKVQKVRGGLKENFILLQLTSAFNTPISVNIYIACANYDYKAKSPIYTKTPWTKATTSATTSAIASETISATGTDEGTESSGDGNTTASMVSDGEVTTPDNGEQNKTDTEETTTAAEP